MTSPSFKPVLPTRVRYIKLGEGGMWEKACLRDGLIRIGFGTTDSKVFGLCLAKKWGKLREHFIQDSRSGSTASRFTNEVRIFFEDDSSILWITFVGERLFWGQVVETDPSPNTEIKGATRPISGGWRCTDINGEVLTKDRLSGALTKLAGYRGTSCDAKDVKEYVVRRINGEKIPEVERAIRARKKMESTALETIRLLTPRDFETMVDLVFSTSGWRRLGSVGGAEKTRDLDLVLPSTGDRAFAQVKSHTSSRELANYVEKIGDGPYTRMFYVYHTGEAKTNDERVVVWGPKEVAERVVEAGLVSWLIGKVG